MQQCFVAVDTGGTFTDLVVYDPARNDFRYTKSLTTHHDPIEGILACVAKTGTDLGAGRIFKHGTTLVINTLIERSGPRVALVTTRGFRDVIELARGNRTESFNLFNRRDPLLCRAKTVMRSTSASMATARSSLRRGAPRSKPWPRASPSRA